MKKLLALALSVTAAISAVTAPAIYAEQTDSSDTNSIFILGDSIAAGTSMGGTVEHRYGDICADYLGWDVDYYAQDGLRTDDILAYLSIEPTYFGPLSDAEVVVLSIGGNNLLRYTAKYALDYAANTTSNTYPMFNEGYSAADIPEDPTIADMQKLLNTTVLKQYFLENASAAMPFISTLKKELAGTTANPTGIVQTEIVPETQEIVNRIREINPDAEIIVQTVYQPVQFSQEFWNESFGAAGNETYALAVNSLRTNLESAMTLYRDALSTVEGIKIADICYEFTSVEKPSKTDQGYAHYFTDIQPEEGEFSITDVDFHPNQKGHIAIACAVLEQIGELHNDNGLLKTTFESLEDKADYPAIALETYLKVAGTEPLVTTTTTTTPTTTSTTSTTTTTSTTSTTTTSTTTTTTTTSTAPLVVDLGDVNLDGKITPSDAALALTAYADEQTIGSHTLSEIQFLASDVTLDGKITPTDAANILGYYAYASTTTDEVIMTIREYLGLN